MRFFCLLSLYLLASLSLEAQVKTGLKLIKNKQYEAAVQALSLDLQDEKNGAWAAWELAQLYTLNEFEEKDLDKARTYALQAQKLLQKTPSKYLSYLQKKGVTNLYLEKFLSDLTTLYFKDLLDSTDIQALDYFLENYPKRSTSQNETIQKKRNELAWTQALKLHKYNQYALVWQRYAPSFERYNPNLYTALTHQLYQSHAAEKGLYALSDFVTLYPQNPYSLDSVGAVKFILTSQKNAEEDYLNFIENYSKSPFVNLAADSLLRIAERNSDPARYDRWLRRFPQHPSLKRAWTSFWLFYKKENTWENFLQLYPHCPYTREELEKPR